MEIISLYVDGACRMKPNIRIAAWAYCLQFRKQEKENASSCHSYESQSLDDQVTNNQMELTAILEGLRAIKSDRYHIVIYSDSMYSINCLTNWCKSWVRNGWIASDKRPVKNREIIQNCLIEIARFSNLEFKHIKGHSGIIGNERVDTLCNIAMNNHEQMLKDKVKK